MIMNIAIGADHGGFQLKVVLVEHLKKLGHGVLDLGAYDEKAVDYPDYARAVALAVLDKKADAGNPDLRERGRGQCCGQ